MRHQKNLITALSILCALSFAWYAGSAIASANTEFIADGVISDSSQTAREEVIKRALSNAVGKAVEAILDPDMISNNFEVLDEKIYSSAEDYVENYEIMSLDKAEGGLLRVKVKANIDLSKLEQDIAALGILKQKRQNPRIMVLAVEYIDGLEQPAGLTQSKLSEILLSKGFQVVDKGQMEMIKARDATLSFSDANKAAGLGRRYGAEIVILAEAKTSLLETSQAYGVSVFAYECSATARAIKTDTAELITSRTVNNTARGGGRVPTANKAITAAAKQIANTLMGDLTANQEKEANTETAVQLVCSGANITNVKDLIKALERHGNITTARERSLTKGVAVIDVELLGDVDSLSNMIIGLKDAPLVNVTGRTQNRIDLKFVQ